MYVTFGGVTYECAVAVKCVDDCYIKLYDENGVEIVSFHDISDFSGFTISGGSFIAPNNCAVPVPLSVYTIGSRTISVSDWVLSSDGEQYCYEIASNLISGNTATCNVFLLFARGTELEYTAVQESGKITLYTAAAPIANVVIESVQIMRV